MTVLTIQDIITLDLDTRLLLMVFLGLAAAALGIVNNAPGTASPIPGMIAPFGFNPPLKVVLALVLAAVGGLLAGYVGGTIFSRLENRKAAPVVYGDPLADDEEEAFNA